MPTSGACLPGTASSYSPHKDIADTLCNAGGFTSVTNVPVNGGTLSYNQKTGERSFTNSRNGARIFTKG
ncbi:MAG: hypothetical protein FWG42_11960 [Clostridiales bacterium]|nr:hypothetical protein [Clostridiales bacterium]